MKRLFILTSLLVVSCGDSGGGGSSANDPSGTWVSECYKNGADKWERSTSIFSGDTGKFTMELFLDDQCKSTCAVISEGTTFKIGDAGPVAGSYKIDYVTHSLSAKATGDACATSFNSSALFGYTDWNKNIEKDILGRKSSATDTDDPPVAGTTTYKLIKIDGNKIYSGDDSTYDGVTPERRPVAIDYNDPGIKQ